MKILKTVCHLGVDKMLKAALGDQLSIVRFRKADGTPNDTCWLTDEQLPFPLANLEEEYDIKIIDDQDSWRALHKVKSRHTIWYVHGTYHTWAAFQTHWNKDMGGVHILFPDEERERFVGKWYKHKPITKFHLPIHLTDEHFVDAAPKRNGLSYTIGNGLLKTCRIYGNDSKVDQLFRAMSGLKTHLYGFNTEVPTGYDRGLVKGPASPIRAVVRDYSVSIHPSHVSTVGFALLEGMAAGVAAVCTPKPTLGGCPGFFATDPASMISYAKTLMENENKALELGNQTQEWVKNNLNIEKYREKISEWLEVVVRSDSPRNTV